MKKISRMLIVSGAALAMLFRVAPSAAAGRDSIVAHEGRERPKVGVVLSGGGAKGSAHIGA